MDLSLSRTDSEYRTLISPKKDERVVYHRNFFLVLNFGKFKSNKPEFVMDSFNIAKDKFNEFKKIVQLSFIWLQNRQEYLQKIVNQKMGTLYS